MNATVKQARVSQLFGWLVLIILALVPFHALLSVSFGHWFGNPLLWKVWKELLLGVLALLAVYVVMRYPDIRQKIINSRINQLIFAFIALHLLLAVYFLPPFSALLAGLAIDLRFFAFFLAAQMAAVLWPKSRRLALIITAVAAELVVIFAMLQLVVLPPDFLKIFGYSKETIAPFLTVDQNPLFVRINSTLRGPNPLGAYVIILFGLLASWFIVRRRQLSKITKWAVFAGGLSLLVVLTATYSRSAALGFAMAALIVVAVNKRHFITKRNLAAGLAIVLLLGGTYYAAKDTYLAQNLIAHKDPNDPVEVGSNEEHVASIYHGVQRTVKEPLGTGPGSTGSASRFGDTPVVIENYYLFVAHEAGWFGIGLFIAICVLVGQKLYKLAATSWPAAGLLASFVGLLVIGLLLPVWADDTVALVWWGLAGLFINSSEKAKL